jgi:DNA-binding NarL/FixJ family response regulator
MRLNVFCLNNELEAVVYILVNRYREEESERALARIAKENMILARKLLTTLGPPSDAGERIPDAIRLSRRQMEVAELVAQGLSSKEVASRLGLSEVTIRNHLSTLFRKFNVSSRIALANALRAMGALPD